jgi:hypothetical protein
MSILIPLGIVASFIGGVLLIAFLCEASRNQRRQVPYKQLLQGSPFRWKAFHDVYFYLGTVTISGEFTRGVMKTGQYGFVQFKLSRDLCIDDGTNIIKFEKDWNTFVNFLTSKDIKVNTDNIQKELDELFNGIDNFQRIKTLSNGN